MRFKNIVKATLYVSTAIMMIVIGTFSVQTFLVYSDQQHILGVSDTSVIVVDPPVCGNNIVEGSEECDGSGLNGNTCISNGFDSGNLSCNSNCTLNMAGCINYSAYCGDGLINYGEECDTNDFGAKQCSTFGYDIGDLVCNSNCTINKLECESLIISPTISDDKLKITPTLINNHYVRPTTGSNTLVTKLPDTGVENIQSNSFNIEKYIKNPAIYVPASFVIIILTSKWYFGIRKKKKTT